MKYKIFQLAKDTSDTLTGSRYDKPVFQYRSVKLIELDFSGQNNDFASPEDAEAFVQGNTNLRGYELVILPYLRT